MHSFLPLNTWFTIRANVENPYNYTRYDLCLKADADIDSLAEELVCLIARLRLSPNELTTWSIYHGTNTPIPAEWRSKFRDRFWRGFVSSAATEEAGGVIQRDEIALQGHIGELLLYVIEHQLQVDRIDAVPRKPKYYSKDSGIDCLEICGNRLSRESLYYIVWESKGITGDDIGGYPRKIYNQHLYETPKVFGEAVDQLSDLYEHEPIMLDFINGMIDDFYTKPPTHNKCFGGSVSYSGFQFLGPRVFSKFNDEFRNELSEDSRCRQIRLSAVGDLTRICDGVWRVIWTKLLP